AQYMGNTIPLIDDSFNTEYNDMDLNVRIVDTLEEAIDHVNLYSTHHSEAIVTDEPMRAKVFMNLVDCSTVYHNASTRFTDGFEFGFGAEIGISTQKLHARGPMGLQALTSYKYFVFEKAKFESEDCILLNKGILQIYSDPKGRYDGISYGKALLLFIVICVIVIKGVALL
ncbi:MAG: hypothetical protein ACLRZ2_10780, partial [Veillonella sp.]